MLMVNHLVGFNISRGTVQTLLAGSVGTWSGTMSANGGIAAVHDDVTNQAQAAGARSVNNGDTSTIVVDWGDGVTKLISRVKLWNINDSNMFDGTTGIVSVKGSTDNFSSSSVTLYTASGISEPGAGGSLDLTMTTATTAYRYHKIEINAGAGKACCAEADFYAEI